MSTNTHEKRPYDTKAKMKTAIYLLVVVFSGFCIVLFTTWFNTADKMMFAGVVSVSTIAIFVWLGISLQKKKLRN